MQEHCGISIQHKGTHLIHEHNDGMEVEATKHSITDFLTHPRHNAWVSEVLKMSEEIDELLRQFRLGQNIGEGTDHTQQL